MIKYISLIFLAGLAGCIPYSPPFEELPSAPWDMSFTQESLMVLGVPSFTKDGLITSDVSRFDKQTNFQTNLSADALRQGASCLFDQGNTVIRHLNEDGSVLEVLQLEEEKVIWKRTLEEESRIDCPSVSIDKDLLYTRVAPPTLSLQWISKDQKTSKTVFQSKYLDSTGWGHRGRALPNGGFAAVTWGEDERRVLVFLHPDGSINNTIDLGFTPVSCSSSPVCGQESLFVLSQEKVAVVTAHPEGEEITVVFIESSGNTNWIKIPDTRARTPIAMTGFPEQNDTVLIAWLADGMPDRLWVAKVSSQEVLEKKVLSSGFSATPFPPLLHANEQEIQIAFSTARGFGNYQIQIARLNTNLERIDTGGLLSTAYALLPIWAWVLVFISFICLFAGWFWGRQLRFFAKLFSSAKVEAPSPSLKEGIVAVRGLCLPEGETLPLETHADRLRPKVPFALEGPHGTLSIDPAEALLFSPKHGEAKHGSITRGTQMVALGELSYEKEQAKLTGPCFLIEGEITPMASALAKSARDRTMGGILAFAFLLSIAIIRGLLSLAT